jgi:hypothetical protein
MQETFSMKPIVAKVEDAAGPRHQGCSCSRLPQSLDNAGDAVSSDFPEGKQHGEKTLSLEITGSYILIKA